MLTLAAVAGLVIALLTGGTLKKLASADFRATEWLFAAFGLQILLHVSAASSWDVVSRFNGPLHVFSYVILLYALWRNLHIKGTVLTMSGSLLNGIVIAANGGKMPVSGSGLTKLGLDHLVSALESGTVATHRLINEATRLVFLSDIVPFPRPLPRPAMGSIGDILMMIGVFIMIQFLAKSQHSELSESTE